MKKPTWSPTWNAMDNVSWSTGLCIKPASKYMGLTQKQEIMTLQNLTTLGLLSCRRAHMSRMVITKHLVESPLAYVYTL